MGYGQLALLPWQVDRLTPAQLIHLGEWATWRDDRDWERTAWMVANLMNASGNMKKAVSVESLLGPQHRVQKEARRRRLMPSDGD